MTKCLLPTRLCATRRPRSFILGLKPTRPLLAQFLTTAQNNVSSTNNEPLTLLHKAAALLPRVFPTQTSHGFQQHTNTSEFWSGILSQAYDDLSAKTERPARIVVYGLDEWANAQDIVTALLEDPLDSDETHSTLLRDRWKDSQQRNLTLIYGKPDKPDPATLQIPASYLLQFPIPLEITEIRPPSSSHPTDHATTTPDLTIDDSVMAALYKADIPIVVCNPVTTPLSTVLSFPFPSKTIVVLAIDPSQTPCFDQVLHHSSWPHVHLAPSKFLVIDPVRANAALRVLRSDPSSFSTVQRYQDGFLGSNVSAITNILKTILDEPRIAATKGPSKPTLRTMLALSHLREALLACSVSLQNVRRDLDRLSLDISSLDERIEEIEARIEGDVLGGQHEDEISGDESEVAEALRLAEKEVREVMTQLNWWKMVGRVDEISSIVGAAVEMAWCPVLEKKLIFHTGRLSTVQDALTAATLSMLSTHPVVPSAILRNTLEQLMFSTEYPLTPQTLTSPLHTRRHQMIEYPATRLHLAGQRAVLGVTGGVLSGACVSWAGWYGWLIGSGEGLFGFIGMDAGTAIGVGILGAVSSLRWAVGKWERSKKQWWQDWVRVGEGLDRDIRATLQGVMREKVAVVATTACTTLTEMVVQREDEIEEVAEDLKKLQACLDNVGGVAKLKT